MRKCEHPECTVNEDEEDEIHTYGLTIDGLPEQEWDYCNDHAPTMDSIDPQ